MRDSTFSCEIRYFFTMLQSEQRVREPKYPLSIRSFKKLNFFYIYWVVSDTWKIKARTNVELTRATATNLAKQERKRNTSEYIKSEILQSETRSSQQNTIYMFLSFAKYIEANVFFSAEYFSVLLSKPRLDFVSLVNKHCSCFFRETQIIRFADISRIQRTPYEKIIHS